jgi:hypothetical protein
VIQATKDFRVDPDLWVMWGLKEKQVLLDVQDTRDPRVFLDQQQILAIPESRDPLDPRVQPDLMEWHPTQDPRVRLEAQALQGIRVLQELEEQREPQDFGEPRVILGPRERLDPQVLPATRDRKDLPDP